MNITQTLRTLMNIPWKKAVLMLGGHGLGKSEVVFQTAAALSKKMKKPFQVIDFRLAQCEVGDLIGMMENVDEGEVVRVVFNDGVQTEEKIIAKGITKHSLAEWFPTDPDSHGFLFLDELFRAPRDLQNAVMELSLDYRYHFKELPKGWRVISASNDDMDKYSGTFPDPALYDRFLKIRFKPTVPEWLEYAENTGVHKSITQYLTKVPSDLDTPESIEMGKIYQSRRAWVHLSDWVKHLADNGDNPFDDYDFMHHIAVGYLGETCGVAFMEYVRKNYKVFTPQDILEGFTPELEKEFKAMLVTEIAFYNKTLIKFMVDEGVKLSKKEGKNLLKYVKAIPKEAAGGFWAQFSSEYRKEATRWYNQKDAQDYIMSLLLKNRAMK